MKNKKLILIISLAIIVGVCIAAVIFIYIKSKQHKQPEATPEGKISEIVMQSPQISPDNEWLYYYSNQNTPAFYRFNLINKTNEQISDKFIDIENITISTNTNYAIFRVYYNSARFEQYGSPFYNPKMEDGEARFWTYSFKNNKLSYLDKNISNAVFSADNTKIIYTYQYIDGKIKINQSNIDGSNYQEIADWAYYEANIYPIDNNLIYLTFASDTDEVGGGLYSLKIKEKELKLLEDKKFSPILSISPSKSKILFIKEKVSSSQIQTELSTNSIDLKNYKTIAAEKDTIFDYNNITWDKNENNVYIAAKPSEKEEFDSIYKINLGNEKPTLFFKDAESSFEAVNINSNENILYYLLNGQLHSIKI